ncbi:MAG: adenylyltransferase/cytidyltransferase family protein [Candidatus Goldbacteria bacterium]|nr:adenylyltransferase/cytidyltransferase family protein [Candidatus Goldiibacteriota bacterium]
MSKIKNREELKRILQRLKKSGKKIVFANGCFDLIHVGHLRFLKSAKKKGDILVVGINSDLSTRKIKGKGRPIINEKQRAEILASFEYVDYVTVFNETTVEKTLEILRPDYHAKGTDYTKDTVPERETSLKYGIKTVIVGDKKCHSTKDIIRVIVERYKK